MIEQNGPCSLTFPHKVEEHFHDQRVNPAAQGGDLGLVEHGALQPKVEETLPWMELG
jgi:hypothetical protein